MLFRSKNASQAILAAIEDARTGVFQPERENDELTRALKNPEHPGRTRGKGVIPWIEGFKDWSDSYKSRSRKKNLEAVKKKQDADRLEDLETQILAAAGADRHT